MFLTIGGLIFRFSSLGMENFIKGEYGAIDKRR
jgi:hypothetical protein